jgi:crotonobetainyl-CoA:carnitine CoA-transferase CaiB-like acyl-CoA transferase
MLLGDLGADIIKVERPGIGDPARFAPNFFRSLNRNKKSLTLNLKVPAAREILYRLAEQYDVFTEGFRPGVANRLGIDYEALHKISPGHDLSYQSMAGMRDCFKDSDGNYVPPGVAIGDLSSGMFAALGIMAALMAREKTGIGQYVDVSMSDGLLSWMSTFIGSAAEMRGVRGDAGYGIFKAGDDQYFTIGIAHEDWFWDRLCAAVALVEYKGLNGLERRQRREELVGKLQEVFSQKSREECIKLLNEADVPVFPVQSIGEVPEDPHVKHREMIQEITLNSGEKIRQVSFPIRLSEMPRNIRMPPPELGEHTDEILKDLGYTDGDIEIFQDEGIV